MEIVPTERDEARFWSKVALPNEQGCMLWLGGSDRKGYGRMSLARRVAQAHRVSYTLAYGPIPEGLQIDHLCRVHACVAPLHLEAVTHQENVRRGEAGKYKRSRTHCPQGHEYDEANTYRTAVGTRNCRTCGRLSTRARRAKKK